MQPGTTINEAVYCEALQSLRRSIQNKRRRMLSFGIILIHDNARPHTAGVTQRLLEQFQWDIFDHPPYSPDLAPSDFHLFPGRNIWLGGQRFQTKEVIQGNVNTHLTLLTTTFFEEGIGKHVHRYHKCLNLFSDYVEK